MAFDLGAFMQRELQNNSVPSRRQVKNASGRSGRKAYAGRQALARVGGYKNTVEAIYAPADKELCVVVPMSVGWKSNGEPNRL